MAGRPKIGNKIRTEKITFNVTSELLSDFKAIASISEKTMVEKIIELMEQEVKKNAEAIQAFRNIQQNTTRNE